MRRFTLFVILFIFAINGFSQQIKAKEPALKKIEKATLDPHSDLFFSTLLGRYNVSDTTMSIMEKRYLYYGFVYQKGFSESEQNPYQDSLMVILMMDELSNEAAVKVIQFADSILAVNPFHLEALNYLTYAYSHLGNKAAEYKVIDKIDITLQAILSSGSGLSEESPFYIIHLADAFAVIEALAFQFDDDMRELPNNITFMKVVKNDLGVDGFFFETGLCDMPDLNQLK